MKLLLIIYSGTNADLVPDLLDRHHAGGYSELPNVHGAGSTGRREGTRAWPGDAFIYISLVPAVQAEDLLAAFREKAANLNDGERLHAAVIPVQDFF